MYFDYKTKLGTIYICAENNFITQITVKKPNGKRCETPLIKRAFEEIEEYLNGLRKTFDLPILPKGTPFQKRVWDELLKIPYGKTISYKELARRTGNEKACRAVGMANNKNPIMIIIPCHRVVGSDGSLTGYAGGLEMKQTLLNLENIDKTALMC